MAFKLPGPDPPYAGSTEPSMGMKDHIKRGIPNLSLSRPLLLGAGGRSSGKGEGKAKGKAKVQGGK